MHHRVETCFPIRHKKIRDRILEDLDLYLRDNTHAWILQADGSYLLNNPKPDEEIVDSQGILLERWSAHV
jgi:polyphosphate kinase